MPLMLDECIVHEADNVVRSLEHTSLRDLDKKFILSLLADKGYLLFRGFDTNLNEFNCFVERCSSIVSLDPAREFFGKAAQKVDAGFDAVGLHCENGNSPFWPDLAWFFCELAASKGSQTTVCDGRSVWQAMPDSYKQRFLNEDIVYSRRVEEQQWKHFVYRTLNQLVELGELNETIALEDINLKHLTDLVQQNPSASIEALDRGAVRYYFSTPAARKSVFSEELAFANSILGPSYNYEAPKIEFSDGSMLDNELIQALSELTEQHTKNIEWQSGDVVLIDNTRVMHGRRKIEDTKRCIYNALSYI
ncbi:TauD/TfdA family dioxygenase [Agaribacterium haliotis]|uniref:TauD/TfdA family dioxygenase n=1 Tax=Agaribacterium haliotis TaxID=2013869 RepID=UPI000BB57743|nr:TauD/TfdA family dioxygenase [Agaribacterium haliotis]